MRKALTIVLAGSVLLALASCGGSGRRSFVRILNASPDAGAIDISINGNKILSGAAYGSGSNYFTLTPGTTVSFKIEQPGSPATTLIDTKIGLVDQAYYTIAAVGLKADSTFTIMQTTDDHSAPASGDVKIRVLQLDPTFHLNPGDSGPADVYISAPAAILNGSPATFPSLTFQSPGSFAPIKLPTDGNQQIRVAPAGDTSPDTTNLAGWDSQTINLTAGQVRTYVLLNNPTGTPYPNQSLLLKDLN